MAIKGPFVIMFRLLPLCTSCLLTWPTKHLLTWFKTRHRLISSFSILTLTLRIVLLHPLLSYFQCMQIHFNFWRRRKGHFKCLSFKFLFFFFDLFNLHHFLHLSGSLLHVRSHLCPASLNMVIWSRWIKLFKTCKSQDFSRIPKSSC